MRLARAKVGMSVQTNCGRFGRITLVDGKEALVQCGPDLLHSEIHCLSWVPSPATIRSRAKEIRKEWTPRERYLHLAQKPQSPEIHCMSA